MNHLADALHDLLNEPDLPLAEAIDRHFAPGYRQRTDGAWDDRDAFAEHIGHLRTIVARATVTVLDELAGDGAYAERHTVEIEKRDGARVTQEVYVFGERDRDGRFTRIEETTLMLEGAEGDRGIGSAR